MNFNVIVVDDDTINLRLWKKILDRIPGCHYRVATDFDEARDLIERQPPDLLISDIILPTQSGYEIADYLHTRHPATPIILTTAYQCDLSRFDLANPRFHILYKPYQNLALVHQLIARILHQENIFEDLQEDSFSENEIFPAVMEWKL